jgi:hypothetical protein
MHSAIPAMLRSRSRVSGSLYVRPV